MKKYASWILMLSGFACITQLLPNIGDAGISSIGKAGLWILGLCLCYLGYLSAKPVPDSVFNCITGAITLLLLAFSVVEGRLICWLLLISYAAAVFAIPAIVKPKSGLEYEQWCADYLKRQGYHNVTVTPGSGDYGADIIAYDRYNNKWVFQCKLYSKNVGPDAVQEVAAARAHYGASKAGVITNQKMTKSAKQLAWENDIELFEMID